MIILEYCHQSLNAHQPGGISYMYIIVLQIYKTYWYNQRDMTRIKELRVLQRISATTMTVSYHGPESTNRRYSICSNKKYT